MRIDGRKSNELRKINIIPEYLAHPAGSVLIECGKTRVICSASIVNEIPQWMKAEKLKGGWITAEYGLLPCSTLERVSRERKGTGGRTHEIQRLIGRTLRASCDLSKIENKTVYIDCDVIDADGGTRCASVTGAMVALKIALAKLLSSGDIKENPFITDIAAISVGIINDEAILDLCYLEDKTAEVDMNVVMTSAGKFVEVQGTAEGKTFSREQMDSMLILAEKGIRQLFEIQKNTLKTLNLTL